MRLEIKGLKELRERLERLRAEEVMARALADQAERIAEAVREGLSNPPGGGEHDRPWLRSGSLRDSIGAQSDGLNAAVGSSDPAAAPQEMGTSRMSPRPFLAPVAASMGEEVAQGVAGAVVAALKGEEPDQDLLTPVSDSSSRRAQPAPYNPAGVFWPGSPENEDFVRGTMRVLRGIGRVFHSEQQDDPERKPSGDGETPPALPANPDDLLQQGWEEISHPDAAAAGHRTFRNKETGMVIRAEKGEPGEPGNQGVDHYHVYNPSKTGRRDLYLDKNGRPVSKGSDDSHILPGEKPW